jgi:hypothetical protein
MSTRMIVAWWIVALVPAGLGILFEVFNVASVLVPLLRNRPGRIPSPVLIVPYLFYGLSAAILANVGRQVGLAIPAALWWSFALVAVWHAVDAVWIVRLGRARFGPRRR